MSFITHDDNFGKDEVRRNDATLITTWTGEDIRLKLKEKKIKLTEPQLQSAIRRVKKYHEHSLCGNCIDCAIDLMVEQDLKSIKED